MSDRRGPSTVLHRHRHVTIGTWRCHPSDPEFGAGWIEEPHVVFPRTCVEIRQQGERRIVAEPKVAVLYRGRQEYARHAIDPAGDRCDWFAIDADWLREMFGTTDLGAAPMARTHCATSTATYSLQRTVVRNLARGPVDDLAIDEALVRIVADVVAPTRTAPDDVDLRHHAELVADVRAHLAVDFRKPLTLASIGRSVGCSPFHLARLFRRHTGESVHRYLTAIRLRAALGLLDDRAGGLADIARDVGFSSHSHLTERFRSEFGLTPSEYRALGRARRSARI